MPLAKVPTGKWFCDIHGAGGKSARKKRMRKPLEEYEWIEGGRQEGEASDDEFSDKGDSASDEEADSEAETEEKTYLYEVGFLFQLLWEKIN
jgi:hypothetical protein